MTSIHCLHRARVGVPLSGRPRSRYASNAVMKEAVPGRPGPVPRRNRHSAPRVQRVDVLLDASVLPLPDVTESGDSAWLLWEEASRKLEEAFAPTQPSDLSQLTTAWSGPRQGAEPSTVSTLPCTVETLMERARRNNRCCPRPDAWRRLYLALGGRERSDLPPPPLHGQIWTVRSDLQKRLFFRDYLEWADRNGQMAQVVRFMDSLAESDWRHMGES
jgi:hypothetical protein